MLARHCRDQRVDVALGRRVDRLLVDDGAVVGVAVGDDTITAGAVVVASGGFGNSPEKLARFFPSAAATEWAWYIGAPGSRGDHLDLAEQVGAQITGYDRGLRLLHANFATIYEAYLPGWLVLVNREGRRFCDETAPYGIMDGLIQEQGAIAFAIFDQVALDEATAAGVARYKQQVPGSTKKQSPHWNADVVEAMVRSGRVHRADTIPGLAASLGLPPGHLQATVDRANDCADDGRGRRLPQGPEVPPAHRQRALLRRGGPTGDGLLHGLRAAHRPRRPCPRGGRDARAAAVRGR